MIKLHGIGMYHIVLIYFIKSVNLYFFLSYYANQKNALCEKINSIFGVTELKPNGRLFLNKNLDFLDIEEKKNNKLVSIIIFIKLKNTYN